MDPISFTASLITILETVSAVVRTAAKLHRKIHDAPRELKWVCARIAHTRAQLEVLLEVYDRQWDIISNSGQLIDTKPLETAAEEITGLLEEIEQIVRSAKDSETGQRRRKRLAWALRDRRVAFVLLEKLKDMEGTLTMLFLAILGSISFSSHSKMLDLSGTQDKILQQLGGKYESLTQPVIPIEMNYVQPQMQTVPPWAWKRAPRAEGAEKQTVGSSFLLNTHWNQLQSTYKMYCLLRIPWPLSRYAIGIQVALQFSSAYLPTLSYSLTAKNLVPSTSRFMIACAKGNLQSVQIMLVGKQGAATDIDESGEPALHKAIRSGSLELVRLLLDCGASANTLEETFHASALGVACQNGLIDVTRLLMVRGACAHHIDFHGTGILANIWRRQDISFSRVEVAKAILAFSTPQINSEEQRLINPLSWVAMTGSGEDIDFLISLGADIGKEDAFGNYPIMYSLWGSNTSTYTRIEPAMPPEWVRWTDERGRTSLHNALLFPRPNISEIIQKLIIAGADAHARDDDGMLPEDIARSTDGQAKNLRIREIGRSQNLLSYVKALRACGYDVEISQEGELYWLADGNDDHGGQ